MDILATEIINQIGNNVIAKLNNNDIVTFLRPFEPMELTVNQNTFDKKALYFCKSECGFYQSLSLYTNDCFTKFTAIEISNL